MSRSTPVTSSRSRWRSMVWPVTLIAASIALAGLVLLVGYVATREQRLEPVNVPADMREWVRGAGDMVWTHTRPGAAPPMQVVRLEECGTYAIVFFRDPDGSGLLWAAGFTGQNPAGADGGESATTSDPAIDARRAQHGPCRTIT